MLRLEKVSDANLDYKVLKEFMNLLETLDMHQYIYKISSMYVLVTPFQSNYVWHLDHSEYKFVKDNDALILGFLLKDPTGSIEKTWIRESVSSQSLDEKMRELTQTS
jgi:hypothetical protein